MNPTLFSPSVFSVLSFLHVTSRHGPERVRWSATGGVVTLHDAHTRAPARTHPHAHTHARTHAHTHTHTRQPCPRAGLSSGLCPVEGVGSHGKRTPPTHRTGAAQPEGWTIPGCCTRQKSQNQVEGVGFHGKETPQHTRCSTKPAWEERSPLSRSFPGRRGRAGLSIFSQSSGRGRIPW